jgi:hypothetical protein
VFLARNQQDQVSQVRVVVGRETERRSFGQDFPAIIDVERVRQLPSRTRRNERVQVERWAALFPDEGVQEIAAVRRPTDHLAARIQADSSAACISVHGSQILDLSVLPKTS